MTRDRLLQALNQRVRRFKESGDASGVLEESAVSQAGELSELIASADAAAGRVDVAAHVLLGWLWWSRFLALPEGRGQADLAAAVHSFSAILHAAPDEIPEPVLQHLTQSTPPDPAERTTAQAIGLYNEFHRTGSLESLNAAVDLFSQALDATPAGHPRRVGCLSNLGMALHARFEQTGQPRDLDAAITIGRQALDAAPAGHRHRAKVLSNLGIALLTRFKQTGQPRDLDAAITADRQAVDATPLGDPGRGAFLSNLGSALQERFAQARQPADLDAAITAGEQAVNATPPGHPDRATFLCGLAAALRRRSERTGQPGDLDAAIDLFGQAVEATPLGHHNRAGCLSGLAAALQGRFERTGQPADLDAAITVGQQAADAIPLGSSGRAGRLSNLGVALQRRFERTGQPADLDAAIDLFGQAVEATPVGHPDRTGCLSNLGTALRIRFERTGQTEDLDAAIITGRQAVKATPAGHRDRAAPLSNLGFSLQRRFERTGQPADLDAAITAGQQAVDATPADHPGRPIHLSNLGATLRARFERTGQPADLDAAITAGQQAVDATPADHPGRPIYLTNLGLGFRVRFERTGEPADLDAAITAGQQAVDVTPADHPGRPIYLSNLGATLQARFKRTGQPADLDAAIELLGQAVDATPADHPHRAVVLSNMAATLQARFERTGQPADLDAVIRCWREAAELATGAPTVRMAAARAWGWWAFEAGEVISAADGHATSVGLLPEVAWHGLDRATLEEQLDRWAGLAADAAACAVAAAQPQRAVEMLEHGRSVLWTQLLQLRGDLTRLREHAPGLAARLDEVRRELDRPLPDTAAGGLDARAAEGHAAAPRAAQQHAVEVRRQLAQQWDDLLMRARRLGGFEHFLAPAPFAELRAAATEGPVVIVNTSQLGCHALIVTAASDPGVRIVALPDLTHEEAVDQAVALLGVLARAHLDREADRHAVFDILDWLWRVIAAPVLKDLGHTAPPADGAAWPRVWWCPTGPLTVLPLHAAGRYARTANVRTHQAQTVPGLVVSSYTATLTGLRRARQTPAVAPGAARQLVVGMPTTPGQGPLPAVPAELGVLARYFPPPLQGRHLIGVDASRAAVRAALPAYPWVHLACHAHQNQADPSNSAFALWDGPLTLADLAALRMDHAELAFLSACQTATGSIRLLDEAVHLAAGLQLLGYRHLIATMWTIADAPAPAVADAVYTRLICGRHPDSSQAAAALHHSIAQLRDAHPDRPLLWAPYIHIGP